MSSDDSEEGLLDPDRLSIISKDEEEDPPPSYEESLAMHI